MRIPACGPDCAWCAAVERSAALDRALTPLLFPRCSPGCQECADMDKRIREARSLVRPGTPITRTGPGSGFAAEGKLAPIPTADGALRRAATALYFAGDWQSNEVKPIAAMQLWTALRDALGIPAGTATIVQAARKATL